MTFKLEFTFGIKFRPFYITDNAGSFNRINLLEFFSPRNSEAFYNDSQDKCHNNLINNNDIKILKYFKRRQLLIDNTILLKQISNKAINRLKSSCEDESKALAKMLTIWSSIILK